MGGGSQKPALEKQRASGGVVVVVVVVVGGGGGLKNTDLKNREQNRGVVGALKIVQPTVSFPTTTLTQLGH